MFSSSNYLFTCVILLLYSSKTCTGDNLASPSLVIYVANEPEYTDVLVRRVDENMTLVCELRGDATPQVFVWNYIPENGTTGQRRYQVSPSMSTSSSTLSKQFLTESDSGHYMCSAPPFSVTKYILVQPRGPKLCALRAFWCGSRCMAAQYVCDGYRDCERGEDEARPMCEQDVCTRSDKLNCSTGRCISSSACCRGGGVLCQQPSCCDEYPRFSMQEGLSEQEYPPLYDDRHAPDDYGFIQSTIYTVTACALIFMIAVVLLVSAICKMHMKRAALRSYAHAERATRHHYTMQYAQTHRFPPCYEASRLLEQERTRDTTEPPDSPARPPPQCSTECSSPAGETEPPPERGGLARLSAIFSSRYRQVPTQSDVELTNVRSTSLNNSPTRNRSLDNYRSPTYCDLNSEFFFTDPDTGNFARDLNIMATPIDFRPSPLDRVMDQFDRQRLTLQLGRFQLTIPRFGRRTESDRRPDTPNVAEINIDDLDFVRMTSNDTYTLNGRTIRLLGANFENYPVLPDGTRPPPYNEAIRYKFFGPPPEYLSREVLNSRADEEARNNIEMPPCYDELSSDIRNNVTIPVNDIPGTNNNGNVTVPVSNDILGGISNNGGTVTQTNDNVSVPVNNDISGIDIRNNDITVTQNNGNVTNDDNTQELTNGNPVITVTNTDLNSNNNSINAIIDNLPAIDSDVNANDTLLVTNTNIPVNN